MHGGINIKQCVRKGARCYRKVLQKAFGGGTVNLKTQF